MRRTAPARRSCRSSDCASGDGDGRGAVHNSALGARRSALGARRLIIRRDRNADVKSTINSRPDGLPMAHNRGQAEWRGHGYTPNVVVQSKTRLLPPAPRPVRVDQTCRDARPDLCVDGTHASGPYMAGKVMSILSTCLVGPTGPSTRTRSRRGPDRGTQGRSCIPQHPRSAGVDWDVRIRGADSVLANSQGGRLTEQAGGTRK